MANHDIPIGPEKEQECEKWSRSSWLLDIVPPRAESCVSTSRGEADDGQRECFLHSDALQLLGKLMSYTGLRIRIAPLSQM